MEAIITQQINEIGSALVSHSSLTGAFSAQRGTLDGLFPYLHLASKRLSARAISRWLQEEKGIKLSDVSISKVLRKPEQGWRDVWEDMEPFARSFSDAHSVYLTDLFFKDGLFDGLRTQPPMLDCYSDAPEVVRGVYEQYETASASLDRLWFSMPAEVRALGLSFIEPFVKACDAEQVQGAAEAKNGGDTCE